MRYLLIVLALAGFTVAAEHPWQSAEVVTVSASERDGAAVAPIGTMLVGVPIRIVSVYYTVRTADTNYVLFWKNQRKPLNVTIHGTTKLFVDGEHAHILDDAGHDKKLLIVQKSRLRND